MGSGGFTTSTQSSQIMGSGARSEDGSPIIGSGTRAADSGQVIGSGGYLGNGGRTEETSPILGSGGRAENGGFLGSGNSIHEIPLFDGLSLLVVSSEKGTFVIPFEQ